MIEYYNPHEAPDPEEWAAMDDQECNMLIEEYHRQQKIDLPNVRLHAAIHCAVENQIAMGDEINAAKNLKRLIAEGLDRHDAVHAIGCVLSEHMHNMMTGKNPELDQNVYYDRLDQFTADDWLAMAEDEENQPWQ